MRKNCVELVRMVVYGMGVTKSVVHRATSHRRSPADKLHAFPQTRAQKSDTQNSFYTQVFEQINRLNGVVVHIFHRPYKNYNYLYK